MFQNVVRVIVLILVLIAALNLGAIGFFDFDAIMWLANIVHPAITNPETAELMVNPLVKKCTTILFDVIWVAAVVLIICKIFVKRK